MVFKKRCYDSIKDVPERIDLAVITTPATVVPDVFRQCCEADVGSAIIVGAGFAEAGDDGQEYHRKLVELSEEYAVPFCGPNTFGLLSAHDNLIAAQVSALDFEKGNVSVVTQSGGLMNQIIYSAIERGYGFSHLVDSGNEASISSAEYIDYFLQDENTDVIAAIVEGFSQPEKFIQVAHKALESKKPIIVLKLARSERGGEIAQSHTGSITTSDDVVTSVLKQSGIIQVETLDMFVEVSELFSKVRQVSGSNLAVIEISGGGCALFSDATSETTRLSLPTLSTKAREQISECIPSLGNVHNPVDLGVGWGTDGVETIHRKILEALDEQQNIDIVISRLSVPQTGPVETAAERFRELEQINSISDTQYIAVSRTSGQVSDKWRSLVSTSDLPFLQEYHKSVRAIDHLAFYSDFLRTAGQRNRTTTTADRLPVDSEITNEYRAKETLAEQGLPTVQEKLATSIDESVEFANAIGYPVCLKIVSDDILHKSDIGGVKIDLATPDEVCEAYREIKNSVTEENPKASIDGVLVQEMVESGVEMLVGSLNSPFGPIVVIGAGGIFAETLNDVSMRSAPITHLEAEEMIQELRGRDILKKGGRTGDKPDVDSFLEFVEHFSNIVAASNYLNEIDLNPVIVSENGTYVVDALFISNFR